jgi:hypothetical protein
MTDSLSDDELQRILQDVSVPGTVSMLRPLELYLSRKWLQDLCRDSLTRIRTERDPSAETEDQRKAGRRAEQQRIDFLAWLQQQKDEEIYIALYPVAEDGLSDDDLDDLMEDFPNPF